MNGAKKDGPIEMSDKVRSIIATTTQADWKFDYVAENVNDFTGL